MNEKTQVEGDREQSLWKKQVWVKEKDKVWFQKFSVKLNEYFLPEQKDNKFRNKKQSRSRQKKIEIPAKADGTKKKDQENSIEYEWNEIKRNK